MKNSISWTKVPYSYLFPLEYSKKRQDKFNLTCSIRHFHSLSLNKLAILSQVPKQDLTIIKKNNSNFHYEVNFPWMEAQFLKAAPPWLHQLLTLLLPLSIRRKEIAWCPIRIEPLILERTTLNFWLERPNL